MSEQGSTGTIDVDQLLSWSRFRQQELGWSGPHQIRSISCRWRKRATTSGPNVNETPRSFSLQPVMSLSGSDHSRSHSRPEVSDARLVEAR